MGWADVKGGKLVEKKGKLANCLLILQESYVLVEPSLNNQLLCQGQIFRLCTAQTKAVAAAQPTAPLGLDANPCSPPPPTEAST